ncbi:MAG TPA: Asp23/Gls24 family envelope stress response protein [Patescibacteria group bacterium]|nr:Asp23/Gls24 family envelope stress response protein [Patescibacteria group bacterium]
MELTGKTIISDDVFAEAARTAMHQVNEVFQDHSKKGPLLGLAQIVTDKVAPQVIVRKNEAENMEGALGKITFELKLTLLYGANIPDVSRKVRESVAREVENLTGYKVERIDITVEKLVKPDLELTES